MSSRFTKTLAQRLNLTAKDKIRWLRTVRVSKDVQEEAQASVLILHYGNRLSINYKCSWRLSEVCLATQPAAWWSRRAARCKHPRAGGNAGLRCLPAGQGWDIPCRHGASSEWLSRPCTTHQGSPEQQGNQRQPAAPGTAWALYVKCLTRIKFAISSPVAP